MKVYTDISLRDFKFWSGAKDRVAYLTDEQLDELEPIIEEALADENGCIDETAINDFFWFEEDTIAEWLGYSSFDALMNGEDDEDDDEDDYSEDEDEDEDFEESRHLHSKYHESYYVNHKHRKPCVEHRSNIGRRNTYSNELVLKIK